VQAEARLAADKLKHLLISHHLQQGEMYAVGTVKPTIMTGQKYATLTSRCGDDMYFTVVRVSADHFLFDDDADGELQLW
jgi:hypothetical protein